MRIQLILEDEKKIQTKLLGGSKIGRVFGAGQRRGTPIVVLQIDSVYITGL